MEKNDLRTRFTLGGVRIQVHLIDGEPKVMADGHLFESLTKSEMEKKTKEADTSDLQDVYLHDLQDHTVIWPSNPFEDEEEGSAEEEHQGDPPVTYKTPFDD